MGSPKIERRSERRSRENTGRLTLLWPAQLYEALRDVEGQRDGPMFKEHQLIRTRRPLSQAGLEAPAGSVGVVVYVYGRGRAYEIEFQQWPGLVVTAEPDALEAHDERA